MKAERQVDDAMPAAFSQDPIKRIWMLFSEDMR